MRVLDSITDALNESNNVGVHEILLVKPEENLVVISVDGYMTHLYLSKDLALDIQNKQKKAPSARLMARVVFNHRRARLHRVTKYFTLSPDGDLTPLSGKTRLERIFSLYLASIWIGTIYLLIALAWHVAERIIYGESMPRVLDDVVAMIMAILIYMLYRSVSRKR